MILSSKGFEIAGVGLLVALLVAGETIYASFYHRNSLWPFVAIDAYDRAPRDWDVNYTSIMMVTPQGEVGVVKSGLIDFHQNEGMKRVLSTPLPGEFEKRVNLLDHFLKSQVQAAGRRDLRGFRIYRTAYDLKTGERRYLSRLAERQWASWD